MMAWFFACGKRWAFAAALVVVALVVIASERAVSTSSLCSYAVVFENYQRRVWGPVNTECHAPHTPPWGNWGVESGISRRWDGFQFAGWYLSGGWRQWNSCTKDYTDPEYYNYGRNHQRANPDNINQYAVTVARVEPDGFNCQTVLTYQDPYMELWELDKLDDDEWVGTLDYPTISFATTCLRAKPWVCRGESAWYRPIGGNTRRMTSKIRITARVGSDEEER